MSIRSTSHSRTQFSFIPFDQVLICNLNDRNFGCAILFALDEMAGPGSQVDTWPFFSRLFWWPTGSLNQTLRKTGDFWMFNPQTIGNKNSNKQHTCTNSNCRFLFEDHLPKFLLGLFPFAETVRGNLLQPFRRRTSGSSPKRPTQARQSFEKGPTGVHPLGLGTTVTNFLRFWKWQAREALRKHWGHQSLCSLADISDVPYVDPQSFALIFPSFPRKWHSDTA